MNDDHQRIRMEKFFRNSPAAIAVVRLADGVMLEINDAYERLFGWSREEVLGKSTADLRIWVDPEERAALRARVGATGRVTDFMSKARRKTGEIFDSLMSSELIEEDGERLLLVIVEDITERRRANEALRESEQRFRALVELSSDWYWATDAEHRFVMLEGAVLRRVGLPPENDHGRRRWDIATVNMSEAAWDEHRALLERREEFRDLMLGRRLADGSVHWASIGGRPLYDAAGDFVGYHGTGRDITREVTAEQQLRGLNEDLERKVAERTATLDENNRELEAFSYTASHDLRAPLRAIAGFTLALREDSSQVLNPRALAHLDRVRAATARMERLIEDLMALSRAGKAGLAPQAVDLTAIALTVARDLEAGEPERQVAWHIAPGLHAEADEGLMRVVLENLLGNAWKYTRRTAHAEIGFDSPNPGTFQVSDNGAGFDPAYGGQLFQPFRRLHGSHEFEGSGVGLATVRRVIERHGGRVEAEGSVGRGAVIRFTLPGGSNASPIP